MAELNIFIVSRNDGRSNNSRWGGVWGIWGSGQLGGGRVDLALPDKVDRQDKDTINDCASRFALSAGLQRSFVTIASFDLW